MSSKVTATPSTPDVDTTPQPYENFAYGVLNFIDEMQTAEGEAGPGSGASMTTDMAKQILFSEGVDALTYEEVANEYSNVPKAKKEFAKKEKFPLYYKDSSGNIKPMIGYDGTGRGLLKAYRNTLPAGQLTQFNKAYEKAQSATNNKNKNKGASRFN